MSSEDDPKTQPKPAGAESAGGADPGSSADPGGGAEPVQLRKVTDARTLRALAHPVRVALIEELSIDGPLTATQVGERIGESPTTCSFHLRQLAKYHFVEEAGGGKGRARPWRMTSIGVQFSTADSPELELASIAVLRMWRERVLDRYRTWLETRATYPKKWRQAASESQHVFYLTAEELEALNAEVLAILLPRFRERLTDPAQRPAGSLPVELMMFSHPMTMPPQED
jgi:DNA-binding transcriptional ArsR family regulator